MSRPAPLYKGKVVRVAWTYLDGLDPAREGWRVLFAVNTCYAGEWSSDDFSLEEAESIRDELDAAIFALRAAAEELMPSPAVPRSAAGTSPPRPPGKVPR